MMKKKIFNSLACKMPTYIHFDTIKSWFKDKNREIREVSYDEIIERQEAINRL
jgi:hypothetical protein